MKRRNVLASGFLFTAVALNCFGAEIGKYYTQVNIWYEHPQKIYNTNYHMGQILPIGSEVEVIAVGKDKIRFKDQKSGVEFLLIQNPKHSTISFDAFFDRHFKAEASAMKFSEKELTNIKAGTVEPGMSKAAVLAAYGYPPSHTTPSTDGDVWMYWVNRFKRKQVTFSDGKVSNIL